MKKKLISMMTAVCCVLTAVSAQAYSLAWNEAARTVSVTADAAGTYEVVFTNNNGNTAFEEVTFSEAGTQELAVPTSFASSKVFLWDSIEQMKPLTKAMGIADCYGTAVVDSVAPEKVYFKAGSWDVGGRWVIDSEADIRIIKDGEEIDYTELEENDVLTIAYDVESGFESSEFYDVYVSTETVEGDVTAVNVDPEINTLTINGREYRCNYEFVSASDVMLTFRYIAYLDTLGNIVYLDEIEKPKNYGIIVGMYMQADNEYATVQLITADGSIKEYECCDNNEEDYFYELITEKYYYNDETVTKSDIINGVGIENVVCEYEIDYGKIRFKDVFPCKGGMELEYKASSNKLGAYAMNDEITICIDIRDYIEDAGLPEGISTSEFVDNALYEAYLCDKNNEGIYRFVIIVNEEIQDEPEETPVPIIDTKPMAVIKSLLPSTEINGVECYEYAVCQNGNEETTVCIEKAYNEVFSAGDVIVYTLNEYGYAESEDVMCVMNVQTNYDTLLEDTLSYNNFSEMINPGCIDLSTNQVLYKTDKKVELYFGMIYTKSGNDLILITDKNANGLSDVDNMNYATEFTMDSETNVCVYDYSQPKTGRVSIGHVPAITKSFWRIAFAEDYDTDCIDWAAVLDYRMNPNFALIKTINYDVTDVVVFEAE